LRGHNQRARIFRHLRNSICSVFVWSFKLMCSINERLSCCLKVVGQCGHKFPKKLCVL
jgi:hypothetical protein